MLIFQILERRGYWVECQFQPLDPGSVAETELGFGLFMASWCLTLQMD